MPGAPDRIEFPSDGASRWAGMADLVLLSPDGRHAVTLLYAGEPPHGDSYHRAEIDGVPFPGWIWGGNFAFAPDGAHVACGWMAARYERKTVVIDLGGRRYYVLPRYLVDFVFRWPMLVGCGGASGLDYRFEGGERWKPF
jgi:hypothetical protein